MTHLLDEEELKSLQTVMKLSRMSTLSQNKMSTSSQREMLIQQILSNRPYPLTDCSQMTTILVCTRDNYTWQSATSPNKIGKTRC